jgi:hypothetical protein
VVVSQVSSHSFDIKHSPRTDEPDTPRCKNVKSNMRLGLWVPLEKLSANKHTGQVEVFQYKFLIEQYLFLSPGTLNQTEALLVLGRRAMYSSSAILALLSCHLQGNCGSLSGGLSLFW